MRRRCPPTPGPLLHFPSFSIFNFTLTPRSHHHQATLVGGDASTDVTIFYRPGGVDEDEQGGADGTPKRRAPPPPRAQTRLRGGGKAEAAALDLIFDHYAEFMVVAGGKAGGVPAEVHLTGYELPDADGERQKREDMSFFFFCGAHFFLLTHSHTHTKRTLSPRKRTQCPTRRTRTRACSTLMRRKRRACKAR